MTVETNANFIGDLNEAYPTQRDLINEGDDHIRLVKAVLKKTFPGMDKAVTLTSDKMNQFDQTLVYGEDGVLKINNSLELKEGSTTNFNGSVLSNVGDPKEATDAVNLQSLQGKLMWPIGSIFMTIDVRNPEEIFGFGKWVRFAEGRVIIGSGSSTDSENNSKIISNETMGGKWLHKITSKQMPVHTHDIENLAIKPGGEHRHTFPMGGGSSASGGRRAASIDTGPNDAFDWSGQYDGTRPATDISVGHTHEFSLDIKGSGGDEKIPMDQPWMACNIWKRTE